MKVGTDGVLLGAWAGVENAQTILDIGTGSGLIALMVAQRANHARIDAVELDAESAAQASENAAASPWSDRVRVFPGSIQEYASSCEQAYDLIVSNPPFFTQALKSPVGGRNQVRHAEALPYEDLVSAVAHLLAPEGRFCLILPAAESKRLRELGLFFNLFVTRSREVCTRPGKPVERVLMQLERLSRPPERESVLILHETEANTRSAAFQTLTQEYYL